MTKRLNGSYDELAMFFKEAFTAPSEWRIGLEFEKLGVHPETATAVSYSGPEGVEQILNRLSERYAWTPSEENGRILGLERGESRISLEPGAQFELSGSPHPTLHGVSEEIEIHLQELREVSDPNQQAWIGYGIQPLSQGKDIEIIPKQRYAIMNRYLPSKGELAIAMMREIAAVQLNLDYESEQDAMEKFRLAMTLSPLLTALFANSSISQGRPNGYLCRRAYIWQHTDPQRCGFIESLYQPEASFKDYIDYALDVPMLFIIRENNYIEIAGDLTFRQFIEYGFQHHRALWEDWTLHLSTIFTEARFKPFLEIRGADCPPPGLIMAFPALVKGILYDEEARKTAWEIVQPWSSQERQALYITISKQGVNTEVHGVQAKEIIHELLHISRQGLKRQARLNARGEDESVFLDPITAFLERGINSPAEEALALWNTKWQGDLKQLIDFYRF